MTDESYIELVIKEQLRVTPKQGFNVCIYDEQGNVGDKLTVVKHTNTAEEAREIAKSLKGEKVYIYGDQSG